MVVFFETEKEINDCSTGITGMISLSRKSNIEKENLL
jgi:hypothetical protein